MAVVMKRSTNRAPLSLSTSYLIGSAFMGISMMTLNSSGALAPGDTWWRLMGCSGDRFLGNTRILRAAADHPPRLAHPVENTMFERTEAPLGSSGLPLLLLA